MCFFLLWSRSVIFENFFEIASKYFTMGKIILDDLDLKWTHIKSRKKNKSVSVLKRYIIHLMGINVALLPSISSWFKSIPSFFTIHQIVFKLFNVCFSIHFWAWTWSEDQPICELCSAWIIVTNCVYQFFCGTRTSTLKTTF